MLKRFIALMIGISLFSVGLPLASAEETEPPEPQCDGGKTFKEIQASFFEDPESEDSDQTSAAVLTELSEPLGGFDDTLTSNGQQVVKVYWKYSCYDGETKTSMYIDYETGCPDEFTCTVVQLIAGQSGTGILKTYIAMVYRWAAGIVGIVAVLVIVISGIQISTDQGSGEAVGAAKTRILQSLAGLAVLFLSALILYTINPIFFQQ